MIRDLVSQEFLNKSHEVRKEYIEKLRGTYPETTPAGSYFEFFDPKDAVVWIDPLDGTSDFVKGNLPAVTVLIGLSLRGSSRIGVVHNPFGEEDAKYGRTLFGTIEQGLFKIDYDEEVTDLSLYKSRPISYMEPFDHHETA